MKNKNPELLYSAKFTSCFYSFEMSAIIHGHGDYLIDNVNGILYIDEIQTFKNTSLDNISESLKQKINTRPRRIICNNNLLVEMLKPHFDKDDIKMIELEDDEKRIKELTDLYKGLKADKLLIENIEVPIALKHLKLAYLSFIELAIMERKKPHISTTHYFFNKFHEDTNIEPTWDWDTGRRIIPTHNPTTPIP